jgi:hypothetical protein
LGGGGLCVADGGIVYLLDCIVTNNRVYAQGGAAGGIWVGNGGELNAKQSVISDNYAWIYWGGGWVVGGLKVDSTGICNLSNCIVAANSSEHGNTVVVGGIYSSGTLNLMNVTIADNDLEGIRYANGIAQITNSIVYSHNDDLVNFPTNTQGVVSNLYYSFIGNGDNAGTNGCITGNPLFVDNTYYHLQSVRGNYTNGYFSGGGWGASESNSPCVDAGNPASDFSLERSPNGHRINMGAYGNTPKASLSKSAPVVFSVH